MAGGEEGEEEAAWFVAGEEGGEDVHAMLNRLHGQIPSMRALHSLLLEELEMKKLSGWFSGLNECLQQFWQ